MAPTEDERFSQHTTTVKRLKFPSVFRPPDSLPFVALHIFLYQDMLKIYQNKIYQSAARLWGHSMD